MIMNCLYTVTYSFKINDEPVGYVHPRRGIRQGDPISPFIFVICAEGLSSISNWTNILVKFKVLRCVDGHQVLVIFFLQMTISCLPEEH